MESSSTILRRITALGRSPLKYLLLVVIVLLAIWILFFRKSVSETFQYSTVSKGDLTVNISATGTVEPEDVVDVGAQVAGQILSFGTDISGKQIDYGSEIEAGKVIAKIDDTIYQSELIQATAQLKSSQAQVVQTKAKLRQAQRDFARAQKLGIGDALSKSSFDSYQATFESAEADVGVAEATVTQSEAAVSRAKRNVDFCTILSPVSGVIIDRKVNIGQTVVSSLNAPSLFLIAKDLGKIQVWVSVNEADIGRIVPGQTVQFSVDAFPGEQFHGQVKRVRLNATMSQNVVTYIVEVTADNTNGKLIPYLTANVKFLVSSEPNVFLVQNAALRFTPRQNQVSRRALKEKGSDNQSAAGGTLWIDEGNGKVRALPVTPGSTDGIVTVVSGEGLSENLSVVSGSVAPPGKSESTAASASPFLPTMPKGGGRRF